MLDKKTENFIFLFLFLKYVNKFLITSAPALSKVETIRSCVTGFFLFLKHTFKYVYTMVRSGIVL